MSKILIVDDEASIRDIFNKVCTSMGHECIEAENGADALVKLKDEDDINLIITDMIMPVMGGRELIEQLRVNSEFSKIPIIIISAYVGIKDVNDLLMIGATFFLAKPVELEELKEYVTRSLKVKFLK